MAHSRLFPQRTTEAGPLPFPLLQKRRHNRYLFYMGLPELTFSTPARVGLGSSPILRLNAAARLGIAALLSFTLLKATLQAQTLAAPRLCGIINLSDTKRAVLELPTKSPAGIGWSILAEGQREGDVRLLEIHPETGSVKVNLVHNPELKTLNLTNTAPNGLDAATGIVLENAPLESLLSLFGEFSGHTLLRWPSLTNRLFSVGASNVNKANVTVILQRALTLGHLEVIPDGDNFLMIVPESEAAHARPGAPKVDSSGATTELLPPGAINFPNTDITQVMQIYAELVGKKLDRSARYPMAGTIHFKNQTPLTKQEVVYALDMLFAWNGVKMAPLGESSIKPVPALPGER